MTPETRYANSEGVSIAYQVLGEGALDLVVVPGWVSNLDVAWEEPAVGDSANITGAIEKFLTGVRHHQIDDRVLATVMFTDIVGATETAARLGDKAWRALLTRHHDAVRPLGIELRASYQRRPPGSAGEAEEV